MKKDSKTGSLSSFELDDDALEQVVGGVDLSAGKGFGFSMTDGKQPVGGDCAAPNIKSKQLGP